MSESGVNEEIGLCLSGGGFRAALFHLGVLRRLNELALLTKTDKISSVSGGSILSAHLAHCISTLTVKNGIFLDWDAKVAEPFRDFCRRDIRTRPILLRWAVPLNWLRRSAQVNALMTAYQKYLTDLKLTDLPSHPEFVFCATDITYGVSFEFRKEHLRDYRFPMFQTPEQWRVARAVAASSCFPPIFDPMALGKQLIKDVPQLAESKSKANRLLAKLKVVDGGVYDNLGMEPINGCQTVLVSDGGAPFREFTGGMAIRQWLRYFDIASNQVGALRKRWFHAELNTKVIKDGKAIAQRNGTYWGIGSASLDESDTSLPGYSKETAVNFISRIRTDLDGFTQAEIAVLENHGYLLANRVIKHHAPGLANTSASLTAPHQEWLDDAKIRLALANSHKRFSMQRILTRISGQAR